MIVVWDGGTMHKGDPIAKVQEDYPRLSLERLPPYAPELNPVEFLWNHLKYGVLANFAPDTVLQLDAVLQKHLTQVTQLRGRIVHGIRTYVRFWPKVFTTFEGRDFDST